MIWVSASDDTNRKKEDYNIEFQCENNFKNRPPKTS